MAYWLAVAGLTDIGRERDLNEDRFYFKVVQSSDEGPLGLFVVADGMGGQLAGEVASYWAVQALRREMVPLFRPQDPALTRRLDAEDLAMMGSGVTVRLEETDLVRLLQHAVERANQVLLGYARKYPDQAAGMGSTLTLAVVQDRRATVVHVGDSRAYLWRDGELRQLTEDHSVPGALLKQGKIEPDEVYDHPHRNVLYRCLGLKPGIEVDHIPALDLRVGDGLLLCSDGLWDMVHPAERLAALLAVGGDPLPSVPLPAVPLPTVGTGGTGGTLCSPSAICRRLLDAANEAGGDDNITVVWARMEGDHG